MIDTHMLHFACAPCLNASNQDHRACRHLGHSFPTHFHLFLTRVPLRTSTLSRATVRSLTEAYARTLACCKLANWTKCGNNKEPQLRQSHLGVHVADHLFRLFLQLLVLRPLENLMRWLKCWATGGRDCQREGHVFFVVCFFIPEGKLYDASRERRNQKTRTSKT